jgi:hypothetical protein
MEGEGESNTLRVLVATDCHLGYMKKDEIRRFGSFQAFEEGFFIKRLPLLYSKQTFIKITDAP